jgi:hypothetical protein
MDDYPYAVLGANGWLRCDGLHHPYFPTLIRDTLHYFGFTGTPAYHGRLFHEFGRGHCEVHMDILTHPSDPSLTAWFTTATGDDLDDTLERASHQAITEFYERHQPGLAGTTIALFPIWDMCDPTWSECMSATCNHMLLTFHAGWAFTAVGAQQRLRLEKYDHQVEAKDRLITNMRKGNRELLQ